MEGEAMGLSWQQVAFIGEQSAVSSCPIRFPRRAGQAVIPHGPDRNLTVGEARPRGKQP